MDTVNKPVVVVDAETYASNAEVQAYVKDHQDFAEFILVYPDPEYDADLSEEFEWSAVIRNGTLSNEDFAESVVKLITRPVAVALTFWGGYDEIKYRELGVLWAPSNPWELI